MIPLFLAKYGIRLALWAAVAFSILGAGYSGYTHIYDKGFIAAKAICEENQKIQQEALDVKLADIFKASQELAAENAVRQKDLDAKLKRILDASRKEPITIIKDGVCYPSKSFSDSFEAINRQTNQAIKESQK